MDVGKRLQANMNAEQVIESWSDIEEESEESDMESESEESETESDSDDDVNPQAWKEATGRFGDCKSVEDKFSM